MMLSISTLIYTLTSLAVLTLIPMFFKKKWHPKGKHCYVTGGSAGLGLSLSKILAQSGAHVSIVGRNQARLDGALKELETLRQTPLQIFKAYSFSLNDCGESEAAIAAACQAHGGRNPDAMFLCAGAARPGFFVEATEASLRQGMGDGYWVQAWSALAGAKRMARDNEPAKIVFVSSMLGYMSIVGYSSYAPAKYALRGLAETLRQELLLYNVSVQIYFPGTMYTPGYEAENKAKPKITLKIEETDGGEKPDAAAAALLAGICNGDFHISTSFLSNVFRSSSVAATPHNNLVLDTIYGLIGWIALPLWRGSVDKTVLAHKWEHTQYLKSSALFNSNTN